MNHLNIDITSYEIQGETILRDIQMIVNSDDRIAIVGANGAGKTTFLKVLCGLITDYTGSIENIGGISLGYLEQIHFMDESITVREDLRNAFTEIQQLEQVIASEEEKMLETGEYEAYTEALDRFQLIGGYTYENEIDRVARGIGIWHLLDKTLAEVSGGERTKIALVKILVSRPDFLLLDEPTNFIDLVSVEWLEKYLANTWKGGYMIISHDRAFLDATCEITMDIRGARGVEIYHGGYSDSVEAKKKNYTLAVKKWEEQEDYVKSEKELIARFRAGSRAGFAKSRDRQLEKKELLEKPTPPSNIHFSFEYGEDPTDEIVLIEEAFIGRKDPLFYIREIALHRGDRIGIVGENGVGKSTFLKTILKKIPLLEGAMKYGKRLEISYYSQLHEELMMSETIYENFHRQGLTYTRERMTHVVGRYGFSFHDLDTPIEKLSGGERSKILFSILGQRSSNWLILDEPTNHLDYDSRETLEAALKAYEGTVLFISHDRYFVDKVADRLWIIEDGDLIISYGNYEDYRYKKEHGISLDMSLFNAEGEMNLVLEDKLGRAEANRIKEKYARRRRY